MVLVDVLFVVFAIVVLLFCVIFYARKVGKKGTRPECFACVFGGYQMIGILYKTFLFHVATPGVVSRGGAMLVSSGITLVLFLGLSGISRSLKHRSPNVLG